ncbi:MAG: hypothetical protein IKW20_02455 [Bacteroidales bacterium]|jgi:multisubunit Na+/H+ antiporter MnhB subunit|nr:hypothetical protein [Bacteroidales bacterium]
MNNKILKGLVAVLMLAVMVVLVLLIINEKRMLTGEQDSKTMLVVYGLMFCYAAYRVYANIRDMFKK